jgi:hypothetical protein
VAFFPVETSVLSMVRLLSGQISEKKDKIGPFVASGRRLFSEGEIFFPKKMNLKTRGLMRATFFSQKKKSLIPLSGE